MNHIKYTFAIKYFSFYQRCIFDMFQFGASKVQQMAYNPKLCTRNESLSINL